ncbi:hypothetical protein FS837_011145 [Tulasnella sp. UAMH 9824]|nr:hypothetical protein FS837_011145 [Tulasnella sp. UAMH 9824]
MVNISIPSGTNRTEFFRRLRQEVQDDVPESVQDLIREQIIVVQYEKGVRGKRERDVVMDIAQVLPGIELLRTHRKTLSNAVLANSGEIRHLTNFVCRNVGLDEKMAVANLVEGYTQPFEGASLVLERDREAINAYEAEYEEAARVYRQEQTDMASEVTNKEGLTTNGMATEDLSDGEEGRAIEGSVLVEEEKERDRGSQVDNKEEESKISISLKRKKGREMEDQADFSDSQASPSTSNQPPKKRQRANDTSLDSITSEDRNQWINHILTSEDNGGNRSDLLTDFLSTIGKGRKWTILQWEDYIKDNKKYISQQISKITAQLSG